MSLKQPYWAFRQKHIFYHNNNGSRISTLSKSTINVCSIVCFKINSQVNSHKHLTKFFFYCLLNKTACTFIVMETSLRLRSTFKSWSKGSLNMWPPRNEEMLVLTMTKKGSISRKLNVFSVIFRFKLIGNKVGNLDKVTEYATYLILVTVIFYYRNQIFITFEHTWAEGFSELFLSKFDFKKSEITSKQSHSFIARNFVAGSTSKWRWSAKAD